ncbi:MAG: thiamine pyrophosphate-dependent enzyme [Candidatus Baltobacteraceae bacterium]
MSERMSRLELMRAFVAILDDEAVVGGIGNTNFDLFAAGHRPQNFYMLGSMGLALPIALGVALAQPQRRAVGIEGDGSLFMNLGCLATIAMVAPANLTLIVMDNASYQITGGQPTASAGSADFVALARGAGIARSDWAQSPDDFARLVRNALKSAGPSFIGARIDNAPAAAQPPRDPAQIRDRFMQALDVRKDFGAA